MLVAVRLKMQHETNVSTKNRVDMFVYYRLEDFLRPYNFCWKNIENRKNARLIMKIEQFYEPKCISNSLLFFWKWFMIQNANNFSTLKLRE